MPKENCTKPIDEIKVVATPNWVHIKLLFSIFIVVLSDLKKLYHCCIVYGSARISYLKERDSINQSINQGLWLCLRVVELLQLKVCMSSL